DSHFRAIGRRLDALSARPELSAEEAAEWRELSVIWVHSQPTLAPRPPRRLGTPANLPDD
ncbi:MAG: hypothetical protein K2V38_10535, partial [Gemmataceae bacterium]|nr:hypothetical protein [Gemmataceae bacterium]